MKLKEAFELACSTASDINEHLPTLAALSAGHDVVEFGVRTGVSTLAWLYGRPKSLTSYDFNQCACVPDVSRVAAEIGVPFEFHQRDTRQFQIAPCDVLFIDTVHTYDQVQAELSIHGNMARKFIVLHDTTTFGEVGEMGHGGIWKAIEDFLSANPEWVLQERFTNCSGLTILARKESPCV